MTIKRKKIYQHYHSNRKLQKYIISEHDFTYFNLLRTLSPYISKVKKVLDIGCGVGTISCYFGSKGKSVLGVDISKNAIAVAKMNAKTLDVNNNVTFQVIDFPKKELSGKFDLVLLSEVLEHIPDDKSAVKAACKVLKPGGYIIASSPSKNAPLFRLGLLGKFDREVGHIRRYNEKEFRKLFAKSNFKILKTYKTEGFIRNMLFTNKVLGKSIKFIKWYLSDTINFIDRLAVDLIGESQIYIVAKKR